jgi:hypothetical protein
MYIEICKDVIEDAIAKSGQMANDSLDLLQLFAIFSLQGKHIVVVPSLKNDKGLKERLSKVMMPSNVEKLRRNERISYMLPAIKSAVTVYCLVTYAKANPGDDRAIVLNPSRLMKFEPYLESRLITENLMDAKFFNYIAQFFMRKKLLSGIRMRYDAKPGGGSTTCDVVRDEIITPRRFCLVVVDSDKKYPKQPDYGGTAQKVVDVMAAYPCDTCKCYIMEKVMEVENLIPKRIVQQYASNKDSCDMLGKDFSYFDMKVGITLKGLYKDEVFSYWEPYMQKEGLDFSGRTEAKNNSTNRTSYERYIDDHGLPNTVKSGFGSDMLKNVTCTPDHDGKVRFPGVETEMCKNIKQEDLTTEQLAEWDNIGKQVFSWACGLPAISA